MKEYTKPEIKIVMLENEQILTGSNTMPYSGDPADGDYPIL